ncbi:hypothetical protein AUR64_03510 [Haloprofundus marisrubri]|uniref:ArsR family transcriptional regulator n=1 Tax=Haloprofundus marisrubri TaxID=1514971 RepID=A0A0W1RDJ7_9EURY|nr:hypothetical protein [Haloprofundus marisrubri]KTG11577.1 hypothetical protein AUR64_03510 [Haloprofundus marisrubri]
MDERTEDVNREAAATALGALADEARIDILLALWQSDSLGFVTLQEAAGFDDSGRFNYHLDKLVGRFVAKTDDGYQLTPSGAKAVDLVLDERFGPTPPSVDQSAGADCPRCDTELRARYEDGDLSLSCPDCETLVHYGYFPPRGRVTRNADDFLDAYSRRLWRDFTLAHRGVCPHCSGRTDTRVEPDPDWYIGYAAQSICTDCGATAGSTIGLRLLADPAVVTFLDSHGIRVDERRFWTFDFCLDDGGVRVDSTDPLRYLVPIEADGEILEVTVDESATVVETARRRPR